MSVKLIADSITDSHGVPNAEVVQKLIFVLIELGNRIFLSGGNLIGVLDFFPDPSTVSGLQVWFDSNDSSTLTYDGSNVVSLWEDKSANSRDATLSMGQPVFNEVGGPSGKAYH